MALSLGFSGSFVHVNSTDNSKITSDVTGTISSSGGDVNILAYHNFDGSKFTGDNVQALSDTESISLGLDANSAELNANAKASVTAASESGSNLAAPHLNKKVTVKAMSSNLSLAQLSNSGGAIIDLGAVASTPTADSSGTTAANLKGNVTILGTAKGHALRQHVVNARADAVTLTAIQP